MITPVNDSDGRFLPPKGDTAVSILSVPNRLTFAAAVLAVLAVISLLLYSHWISTRAQFMLRTAREFSDQKEPPTLSQLQKYYGTALKKEGCNAWKGAWNCNYSVTVSNRVLAALRLVPYTELKSNFWLRNGVVEENMWDYLTTLSNRQNVTAHGAVQFDRGCIFYLDPWSDSSPLTSNGLATISPDCIRAEKQAVLGLNADCLTKLGGCKSIADLIPTIWDRNASDKIICRIPNREGFVHSPPSWTWLK